MDCQTTMHVCTVILSLCLYSVKSSSADAPDGDSLQLEGKVKSLVKCKLCFLILNTTKSPNCMQSV